MEEKVEYFCECGRHFITIGRPGRAKKCPKCARTMYPKEKEAPKMPLGAKKKKLPFENLDETVEYEYKFDDKGQRLRKGSEPFTLGKLLKKIFTLFSFRGSSYRDY